jgi:hypothetical protein
MGSLRLLAEVMAILIDLTTCGWPEKSCQDEGRSGWFSGSALMSLEVLDFLEFELPAEQTNQLWKLFY